jgi:hypothetical protein
MRILHVLDSGRPGIPGPHGGTDRALGLCAALQHAAKRRSPAEDGVLLLGPCWLRRRAAGLGLRTEFVLSPPLGRPELAARALRLIARDARAVCCWSDGCERAAVLGLGRSFPMIRVRGGAQTRQRRWAYRRAEVDPEGLEIPSLPPARVRTAADLRDRRSAREHTILLLGEGGAQRFGFTLGLLRHAGLEVAGLFPAWDAGVQRAVAFQREISAPPRLEVFDLPLEKMYERADAAVWVGAAPSTTWLPEDRPSRSAIAGALAAGLPTVVPAAMGLDALYPPGAAEACLARAATPPELARKLKDLLDNPDRLTAVSDECRRWWSGRDGAPAFLASIDAGYRAVTTRGGWADVLSQQFADAPGVPA